MNSLRNFVEEKLKNNLSHNLKYHGFHHTLDVVKMSLSIAKSEGIIEQKELNILEAAAWFHDIGFISTFIGHEEESCKIAEENLPKFGFSKSDITRIKNLIMATKIPQNPKNKLEEILADADLDYLGREDYDKISETLFYELQERLIVKDLNDWRKTQIKFLKSHKYWTKTSINNRAPKKAEKLQALLLEEKQITSC
ncbi:HD domain-containing protein [Lacihabitans lacunae]|uniref:HD domain-containing protein n=1 Tax=Lacihabitans lacunae TaxID=1028214 RepID=A0ABV7YZJ0_9BACT